MMGSILGGISRAARKATKFIRDSFLPQPKPEDKEFVPVPASTERYLHVSVPMIPVEDPIARKLFGTNFVPGESSTYNVGNNQLKRSMDNLAASLGYNNKQRRKLRTQAKRRCQELRGFQSAREMVA